MAIVLEKQRVLLLGERTSLSTLYDGMMMQHLSCTPAAAWAPIFLQTNVWVERTKMSRDSQLKKYMRFALIEDRSFPLRDIDLVAYV